MSLDRTRVDRPGRLPGLGTIAAASTLARPANPSRRADVMSFERSSCL